jgi:hypothetical protein
MARYCPTKEKSVCRAKGCKKGLRRDNKSGFCALHFYLSRATKTPRKSCKEPGCNRILGVTNTSGYCQDHRRDTDRESTPATVCKERTCQKKLRRDNKRGYCAKHRYLALRVPAKFCEEKGCGRRLGNNNKSGYCAEHRLKRYQEDHREDYRKRMTEFRARRQELVELGKMVQNKLAKPHKPRGRPKGTKKPYGLSRQVSIGNQVEVERLRLVREHMSSLNGRGDLRKLGYDDDEIDTILRKRSPLAASICLVAKREKMTESTVRIYHQKSRKFLSNSS